MPTQFIFDITASNAIHEIDRFCQYFNIIDKAKYSNGDLNGINKAIEANGNINLTKYKNIVSRRFTLGDEMYAG